MPLTFFVSFCISIILLFDNHVIPYMDHTPFQAQQLSCPSLGVKAFAQSFSDYCGTKLLTLSR